MIYCGTHRSLPKIEQRYVLRFRPLYYKDKSDATNAQYTRVLIYATLCITGWCRPGLYDSS